MIYEFYSDIQLYYLGLLSLMTFPLIVQNKTFLLYSSKGTGIIEYLAETAH